MKLDTKEKIENLLDSMFIERYKINDDLTVDVDGNVYLDGQDFEKFPAKFGKVNGYFSCSYCINLTSLEGSPEIVNGDFYCNDCSNLITLKGSPHKVSGNFNCYKCTKLVSLEGASEEVGEDFYCYDCPNLVSLKGTPIKVGKDFSCINTPIENLFNDTNIKDFAKMSKQEKEEFIIEAYKENRIDERVFKTNVSREKQDSYKGLVSGKKFGI